MKINWKNSLLDGSVGAVYIALLFLGYTIFQILFYLLNPTLSK